MITIGMDYYPEHWDPSMWEEDASRMQKLGVRVVRIAEFAWSRMEPEEGHFTFEWLDEAIRVISAHGMKVILGTPTNCAPLWMYHNYPDTVQQDGSGRPILGIRGHRCLNSRTFRFYAQRIIEQMASRYAGRPEIYAWQIDNELENNHCTCPQCTEDFRTFLQKKYGTPEKLNEAWGTDVWSGEYSSWEQVTPPDIPAGTGLQPDFYNTGRILDHERFGAQCTADYVNFQASVIRRYDPDAVITTNACLPWNIPDFHKEFASLNVASYDNYPPIRLPEDPEALYSNAYVLDFVRGFKQQNFWIMEELAGQMGCWGPISPIPVPGQIEGYALQAVAHGADLLSFFRWRTSRTGAEMFCHGLLDHSNKDNRRLRELEGLCRRLEHYPELDESEPHSQVAILYAADQEFTLKNQRQSDGFAYGTQMKLFHNACMNLGVNADVIEEHAALDAYQVVIVPTHIITDPKVVRALEDFAEKGGTVIITNRSGVKDEYGRCLVGEELPTLFRKLCGCHVTEYDPIGRVKQKLFTASGEEFEITGWCDLIEADTAETIAVYADHYYAGVPAITKNSYGKGIACYIGTIGEKALYRDLLMEIFKECGIEYKEFLPWGVEYCTRSTSDKEYGFLFNNTDKNQSVIWEGQTVQMKPFEMRIQTEDGPE